MLVVARRAPPAPASPALSLDLAEGARARGAAGRDRQRRRHAALPRHGHRHRQAPGGRAARHPAPPASTCSTSTDEASVADYQRDARAAIDDIEARGAVPDPRRRLGLYVSSVSTTSGSRHRRRVRARLEAELERDGPGHAAPPAARASTRPRPRRIGPQNGRRLVRALEVDRAHRRAVRRRACPTRSALVAPADRSSGCRRRARRSSTRLDERVEQMWRDGLVDEVAGAAARPASGVTAARGDRLRAGARAARAASSTEAEAIEQTAGAHPPLRAPPGELVPPLPTAIDWLDVTTTRHGSRSAVGRLRRLDTTVHR